jgi:hypothetical protein
LFYKKEKKNFQIRKKDMALAKKKIKIFVFPHHSIGNKNVGSIKRDAKPRPIKNSRKRNRDKKEGVGSKTYCP